MIEMDQLKKEFVQIVKTSNPADLDMRKLAWEIVIATNGFRGGEMNSDTQMTLRSVGIERLPVEHNRLYRTTEVIRAPLAAGAMLDLVEDGLSRDPSAKKFGEVMFTDLLRSK
ncbi:MAG: hypothetical protein WAV41_03765 [Microgenomates group bacterium]